MLVSLKFLKFDFASLTEIFEICQPEIFEIFVSEIFCPLDIVIKYAILVLCLRTLDLAMDYLVIS